jgi:hypothetical protein
VARRGIDSFACHRCGDRFERHHGAWRILRRAVVFDGRSLMPIPDVQPTFDPSWTIGQRTEDDWLHQERAAMGLALRR